MRRSGGLSRQDHVDGHLLYQQRILRSLRKMTWKRAGFLEEVEKNLSKEKEEREKDDEAVNKLLAAYVKEGCKRRQVLQEFNEHFPGRVPVVEVDLISAALNEEVEEALSKVRKEEPDNLDRNALAKVVFGHILMNKLPQGVKDSFFKRVEDVVSKYAQADQEDPPQSTVAENTRVGRMRARMTFQSTVSLPHLQAEFPPPQNRRVAAPRGNDEVIVLDDCYVLEDFPRTNKNALQFETKASGAHCCTKKLRRASEPYDMHTVKIPRSEDRVSSRRTRFSLESPTRTLRRADVPLRLRTKRP